MSVGISEKDTADFITDSAANHPEYTIDQFKADFRATTSRDPTFSEVRSFHKAVKASKASPTSSSSTSSDLDDNGGNRTLLHNQSEHMSLTTCSVGTSDREPMHSDSNIKKKNTLQAEKNEAEALVKQLEEKLQLKEEENERLQTERDYAQQGQKRTQEKLREKKRENEDLASAREQERLKAEAAEDGLRQEKEENGRLQAEMRRKQEELEQERKRREGAEAELRKIREVAENMPAVNTGIDWGKNPRFLAALAANDDDDGD